MTETPTKKSSKKSQKTVVLTVGLLVVFAFVFLIIFVIVSTSTGDAPVTITADTYSAEVEAVMANADPTLGESLIEERTCAVCHVLGDGTVAPLFTGIANYAGEIRPPLGAEQYLYEAIVYPGVYVLDGYTNSMPPDLLAGDEIGHVIAYLMTLDEIDES